VPPHTRRTPNPLTSFANFRTGSGARAGLNAIAAAALVSTLALSAHDAHALALGRVTLQSGLGEPLRAEIDVPDINAAEAASLRVNLAPAASYRAAGIDINPALNGLDISLQRRADGRAYLRVRGTAVANEPFVDLIVEANWTGGRLVRDYTLLLDPPTLRTAPQPAPVAPATQAPRAPAPAPAASAPRPAAPAPILTPAPSAPRAAAPATAPGAPAAADSPRQITVQRGDTAGRIAMANRPANVSLDQVLVAMLQANPSAFIDGNVNRIRAGAVVDLPSGAAAAAIDPREARQTIAAQSRDFDEYRRRLASNVRSARVDTAQREATGRVQTEVQDRSAPASTNDRLTLSRPSTTPGGGAEAQIAQQRQSSDAAQRSAELQRNIDELAKLGDQAKAPAPAAPAPAPAATAPAPAPAPATAPAASAPAAPSPAPAAAPSATPTAPSLPAGAATAPAASSESAAPPAPAPAPAAAPAAPSESASAPAAPAASEGSSAPAEAAPPAPAAAPAPTVTAPPAVPAPETDEPGFLSQLGENPLLLPLAGGLLALLAGLGLWRARQRKANANVDSSFLESRLQPDSFFGSSGGQRIDTAESMATGSSMVYSPSQLDAAGDVDPVAEADVYLAYGRDLQAEEILKEAMRSTPTRVAIHTKLLEIYAKRRDARAFEVVAAEAFGLTQGEGPEWERACELGRELDPSNPLYQPGGKPISKAATVGATAAGGLHAFGPSTVNLDPPAASGPLDLDLDLGFDDAPPSRPGPVMSSIDDLDDTEALTSAPVPPSADLPPLSSSMSMDFDLDLPSREAERPPTTPADLEVPSLRRDAPDSVSAPSFDLDLSGVPASAPAPSAPAPVPHLMDFKLDDLNLDLDDGDKAPLTVAPAGELAEESPLETKLSLAEEFRAIGDFEGARSLAEEVLAEASGPLKAKASSFLAELSA